MFHTKSTIHFLCKMSSCKTEIYVLIFVEIFGICLSILHCSLSFGTLFLLGKKKTAFCLFRTCQNHNEIREFFFSAIMAAAAVVAATSSENIYGSWSHHHVRYITQRLLFLREHFLPCIEPWFLPGSVLCCRWSLSCTPLWVGTRSHKLDVWGDWYSLIEAQFYSVGNGTRVSMLQWTYVRWGGAMTGWHVLSFGVRELSLHTGSAPYWLDSLTQTT